MSTYDYVIDPFAYDKKIVRAQDDEIRFKADFNKSRRVLKAVGKVRNKIIMMMNSVDSGIDTEIYEMDTTGDPVIDKYYKLGWPLNQIDPPDDFEVSSETSMAVIASVSNPRV